MGWREVRRERKREGDRGGREEGGGEDKVLLPDRHGTPAHEDSLSLGLMRPWECLPQQAGYLGLDRWRRRIRIT